MELKKIKDLAKLLNEYNLSVIDIAEGDIKIRLEKNYITKISSVPASKTRILPPVSESKPNITGEVDFNDIKEFKSPMVGVFYQASSPESLPFVKIGDRIKKGDTLCIIEAMKLMNEIIAEFDGEIIDICAQNGQIVEFGQTLFKIF